MPNFEVDPLLAVAVMFATACTDAVYVLFTNAVIKRRRLPAAASCGKGHSRRSRTNR